MLTHTFNRRSGYWLGIVTYGCFPANPTNGEIIYGDTRWIEDDCPGALTLFLNLFFYFLLQLLCVMISNWLKVLKHKMPSQILIKTAGLVW